MRTVRPAVVLLVGANACTSLWATPPRSGQVAVSDIGVVSETAVEMAHVYPQGVSQEGTLIELLPVWIAVDTSGMSVSARRSTLEAFTCAKVESTSTQLRRLLCHLADSGAGVMVPPQPSSDGVTYVAMVIAERTAHARLHWYDAHGVDADRVWHGVGWWTFRQSEHCQKFYGSAPCSVVAPPIALYGARP